MGVGEGAGAVVGVAVAVGLALVVAADGGRGSPPGADSPLPEGAWQAAMSNADTAAAAGDESRTKASLGRTAARRIRGTPT